MNQKGSSLVLAALLICMAIVSVPSSDAADVSTATSDNVTLAIMENNVELYTSETETVLAHIHNGRSGAVTVSISSSPGSVISVSGESSAILVTSGSTVDVNCTISTDRYTDIGGYDVSVNMYVMDGVNPVSEATLTLHVNVVSQYTSGDQYNKFFGIFENNLGSPFNQLWFTVVVNIVAWILISFAVGAVLYDVIKRIFTKFKIDNSQFKKNTFYEFSLCILVQGVYNTAKVIGADAHFMAKLAIMCSYIYVPLIALVIWDIYRTLVYNALLKAEMKKVSGVDRSLVPLFNLIGKLILIVISIAVILRISGVDLTVVLAAAGIAGLGISLGVKPVIGQIFAGLVLMIERPFKTGDVVKIGSSDPMIVSKVSLLQTEFKSDGSKEVLYYSNTKVTEAKITNMTFGSRLFRKTMMIKLPFGVDLDLAKKLILEAASENPKVVTDGRSPEPKVQFWEYKDGSAINVRLDYSAVDYDVAGSTNGRIREEVLKKFYENGIIFPMEAYEFTIVDVKGVVNES